jgi:hypothetical protein
LILVGIHHAGGSAAAPDRGRFATLTNPFAGPGAVEHGLATKTAALVALERTGNRETRLQHLALVISELRHD